MEKQESWREWDLVGLNVTQLRIDYAFSVHLWSLERDLLIRFGVPFALRLTSGELVTLEPELPGGVALALSILHQPAASFQISSADRCVLRLADGVELSSEPHPKYEAWESWGSGDLEPASWIAKIE